MIHEILPVGPLQCNCSVIGDETTREAMVIDPGDDIEDVIALIAKHKLKVKQIVITHAHIDHVGGAMKLRAATGAPILLNQNDYDLLKMLDMQAVWCGMASPGKVEIDQNVKQADTIKAGSLVADVIHTPGHTEGSVCLYFPLEKKLIAGDTLFANVVSAPTYDSLGNLLDAGSTALYVLPHVLSAGTERQPLATFNGAIGSIWGANARVIAFFGQQLDSTAGQEDYFPSVWDLALRTLVTFPTLTGNMVGFSINLTGTDLAVEQGNETDETVLSFDTSTLPTTPTGG